MRSVVSSLYLNGCIYIQCFIYSLAINGLVFVSDYNKIDPEIARKVDIGLPSPHGSARTLALERSKVLSKVKKDPEMERLARNMKCRNIFVKYNSLLF